MDWNEAIKQFSNKNHPDGCVPGGMMDQQTFFCSKGKMLVLLKEVNDPSATYGWTIPELLMDVYNGKKPFYRVWKNVSRWSLCAENPRLFYQEITDQTLKEGLKLIAAINLKKTAGLGSSDLLEIQKEAQQFKDEWCMEIDMISPNFVLCCGTFDIVKEVLEMRNSIKRCKSGAEYFIYRDVLYIGFLHPANRVNDNMLYAYFKETIDSLITEGELV